MKRTVLPERTLISCDLALVETFLLCIQVQSSKPGTLLRLEIEWFSTGHREILCCSQRYRSVGMLFQTAGW